MEIADVVFRSSQVRKLNSVFGGLSDFLGENAAYSAKRILRMRGKDIFLDNLVSKFENADEVVINGEGSFILRTPPRRDLQFQLCMIELATLIGRPVHYVNAIASECPVSGVNEELLRSGLHTLKKCASIVVRDPRSSEFLSRGGLSCKFVPDALFSWALRYSEFLNGDFAFPPEVLDCWPERPEMFRGGKLPDSYICISGASRHPSVDVGSWKCFFSRLLSGLSKKFKVPVIVIDPGGDAFLIDVAKGVCMCLMPETNVLMGARILSKALLYISGRYHPSILAALGGTPCMFFGSNSHKTDSLQAVLGCKEPVVYGFNVERDIPEILAKAEDVLACGDARRNEIRATAEDLGRRACELSNLIG